MARGEPGRGHLRGEGLGFVGQDLGLDEELAGGLADADERREDVQALHFVPVRQDLRLERLVLHRAEGVEEQEGQQRHAEVRAGRNT